MTILRVVSLFALITGIPIGIALLVAGLGWYAWPHYAMLAVAAGILAVTTPAKPLDDARSGGGGE